MKYRYPKDHIGPAHYEDFFQDCAAHGWEEAIRRLTSRPDIMKPQKVMQFLRDQRRNDFVFLLPVAPTAVVLDFGSGWGNTSYTLSEYCHYVVALEADIARQRFAAAHFTHSGASNILPVAGGRGVALPFADSTFDIILMNGVLEWTPQSLPGRPDAVHRRVLEEVRRVLKPGGTLQISIENRYGYDYLLGKRDHHCGGLRWAPFLPRALANLYSWFWLRRPYRAWFYSCRELDALLRDAGFGETRTYSYFRNHVRYSHLYGLGNSRNVARKGREILVTQKTSWKDRLGYRLGIRTGLFHWIAQDFMVITRKA
jgi:SAM-dependent methyltransferase